MGITRRNSLALPFSLVAAGARAQKFPARPVRIVVPWPPGALTDTVSRLAAERLQEIWGQPVVVENRAGGNGALGSESAARAAPDGHTLVTATAESHAINPWLRPVPYDVARDFAPVSLMVRSGLVLVTRPELRFADLAGLLAAARARPDALRYASWGEGSTGHLALELLRSTSGVEMLHMPYRGAAQAQADLLAGHVDAMFAGISYTMPFIADGRLHPYATTGEARARALPEVPTVAEAGVPGYRVEQWYGLLAPSRTPPEVVEHVRQGVATAFAHTAVRSRLEALSVEIVAGGTEEFGRFLGEEQEKWRRLIETVGLRVN